ncbi:MAG: hypothetical protein Sw2LagPseu_25730 [Shewanella algae]
MGQFIRLAGALCDQGIVTPGAVKEVWLSTKEKTNLMSVCQLDEFDLSPEFRSQT